MIGTEATFMRLTHSVAGLAVSAIILGLTSTGAAAAVPSQASSSVPVCPGPAAAGTPRCHSHVVVDVGKLASTSPTGLSPATIKSVYSFSTSPTVGAGKTIAIVDAYDDPTAENDLGVFSNQYGLPGCTKTGLTYSCSSFFSKVDQRGGTVYPLTNAGWALEISLDIQWAHAIAPGARILLVEADSNSFANLLAAVDRAALLGASYISMSWGGSEFSSESGYDSHFQVAGVSYFASSGDSGFPASYPSASPNVISVGGTTLNFTDKTKTTLKASPSGETGWSGSGGGCSAYETASADQSTGTVNCNGLRATPDVSLDADPASGVSVYDSTRYQGQKGWFTIGGTSASSPMWAARSADAGVAVNAKYVYGGSITYRDITVGSNNGASCLGGYDLVTGRGSWTGSTP